MNKIQNVLNDEESMKQIKEFADMLTADNGGQGEQGGQSEAPQSPQNMDFSQLLQSLGGKTIAIEGCALERDEETVLWAMAAIGRHAGAATI